MVQSPRATRSKSDVGQDIVLSQGTSALNNIPTRRPPSHALARLIPAYDAFAPSAAAPSSTKSAVIVQTPPAAGAGWGAETRREYPHLGSTAGSLPQTVSSPQSRSCCRSRPVSLRDSFTLP